MAARKPSPFQKTQALKPAAFAAKAAAPKKAPVKPVSKGTMVPQVVNPPQSAAQRIQQNLRQPPQMPIGSNRPMAPVPVQRTNVTNAPVVIPQTQRPAVPPAAPAMMGNAAPQMSLPANLPPKAAPQPAPYVPPEGSGPGGVAMADMAPPPGQAPYVPPPIDINTIDFDFVPGRDPMGMPILTPVPKAPPPPTPINGSNEVYQLPNMSPPPQIISNLLSMQPGPAPVVGNNLPGQNNPVAMPDGRMGTYNQNLGMFQRDDGAVWNSQMQSWTPAPGQPGQEVVGSFSLPASDMQARPIGQMVNGQMMPVPGEMYRGQLMVPPSFANQNTLGPIVPTAM